jgi:hypothetical protein
MAHRHGRYDMHTTITPGTAAPVATIPDHRPEPLAVDIPTTGRLGGWGRTTTYALIESGDLESFTIGKRRLVTVESIRALIARRVAAARAA